MFWISATLSVYVLLLCSGKNVAASACGYLRKDSWRWKRQIHGVDSQVLFREGQENWTACDSVRRLRSKQEARNRGFDAPIASISTATARGFISETVHAALLQLCLG